MLANTRFRTFALIALPCVVFIYLLQRNTEYGASHVVDSFHHYTQKLKDLGAIEAVQEQAHKWSEALPWKPAASSKVDAHHIDHTEATSFLGTTSHSSASLSDTSASLSDTSTSLSDTDSTLDKTLPTQATNTSGYTLPELPYLQDLCHETNWTQGLWLRCTSYCGKSSTAWCGGLNNARTRLQNCLRLAIDAGAGVILPQIGLRGTATEPGDDSCVDDWFDLAYTDLMIRTNCPQLKLSATCPDAADRRVALPPPPETDLEMVHTPGDVDGSFATGEFRQNLVLPTLQNAGRINGSSGGLVDGTTILEYGDTFVGWKYNKSNENDTVRKDLYKSIRFRSDLHQIGEKIRDSEQLQHGSYIAVHLRGEGDWPLEWGTPTQQMAMYVEEMAKIRATDEGRNVSAVFVSSGEQGVIQVFRDMLQPLNYTVHDKWTVLADFPADIAAVEQADFDAMGIVDDAALTGAMYFMGLWMSTFSQNVAYARTIDDEEDFMASVLFHNAVKQPDNTYVFPETPTLQGNNVTKIIVFNGLSGMADPS